MKGFISFILILFTLNSFCQSYSDKDKKELDSLRKILSGTWEIIEENDTITVEFIRINNSYKFIANSQEFAGFELQKKNRKMFLKFNSILTEAFSGRKAPYYIKKIERNKIICKTSHFHISYDEDFKSKEHVHSIKVILLRIK